MLGAMTHGTASGWRWHGCRCSACHRALLDEGKLTWAMRRVRAGHDPGTRVPAVYARRRLRELQRAGLTRAEVAHRAGISAATISRLANRRTKRVSRIVANAVMAIQP